MRVGDSREQHEYYEDRAVAVRRLRSGMKIVVRQPNELRLIISDVPMYEIVPLSWWDKIVQWIEGA